MSVILIVALVLSLVGMAAALFTWRAGVRGSGGVVLVAGAAAASTASMLIGSDSTRYGLWGLVAILLVLAVATWDRPMWRAARPLLWLGGALIGAIVVSASLTDVPPGIQQALLGLVVALSLSFFAALIVMGMGLFRTSHESEPKMKA